MDKPCRLSLLPLFVSQLLLLPQRGLRLLLLLCLPRIQGGTGNIGDREDTKNRAKGHYCAKQRPILCKSTSSTVESRSAVLRKAEWPMSPAHKKLPMSKPTQPRPSTTAHARATHSNQPKQTTKPTTRECDWGVRGAATVIHAFHPVYALQLYWIKPG